jgi:hypothetical protein
MPKIQVKKFYQDLSCYAIIGDKLKKKIKLSRRDFLPDIGV